LYYLQFMGYFFCFRSSRFVLLKFKEYIET